jgi:hypothetical protein
MYRNLTEHDAAAVQAELRKTIVQLKQQKCVTRNSYKSGAGARGAAGRLAGLEIPFFKNLSHGSAALDPLGGTTSFERQFPASTDKMYVGLAQTGFTVEWEHFHETDAGRGNLPVSRFDQRDMVMKTYLQEHNWYAISNGYGTLAIATTTGGSGTRTFAYDATARDRSKGSIRLAISTNTASGKRILYQSYNTSTDTLGATFYITSKASALTAVVVVTDGGTITAGEVIVKYGHYKKVPYGNGYHFNSADRWYQGVDTANYSFLNSTYINGGGGTVTPTMMDSAKAATQGLANDINARKNRVCHMTINNYKILAAFDYNLRQYNAEKGQADTTYGVPQNFSDEDTDYILDADYEEAFIDMRDRKSYFEYRQQELEEISEGPTQYVGANSFGSTEKYQNWGESYNLAWDGRGDDGKGDMGSANSSVYIGNLAISGNTQVALGKSLV